MSDFWTWTLPELFMFPKGEVAGQFFHPQVCKRDCGSLNPPAREALAVEWCLWQYLVSRSYRGVKERRALIYQVVTGIAMELLNSL